LSTVHVRTSDRRLGEEPKTRDDGDVGSARMLLQWARVRAQRKHKRTSTILAALSGDRVVLKVRVRDQVRTERWAA
jgi:hypothetical protein